MRTRLHPLLAGALLAASACADSNPLAPSSAAFGKGSVTEPVTGPWARIVEGETGPGSLYAIYVPREWNGDAVFYAHGIRPPLAPITLSDQDNFFEVRDALGAQGYAFVYSSFSENGLVVKDGALRTHQLRGLLASEIRGQPVRSYLAGYSLGAGIAVYLAEHFPRQYDGALSMCGMIGGSQIELDYAGHVRALFDYFYPGVLPGDVTQVTEPLLTQAQITALVVGAISSNPTGLYSIASTVQTPLAYAPIGSVTNPADPAFQTLVQSLVTALYYQHIGTNDMVARTHGHTPVDNTQTVYTVGTLIIPNPALAFLIAQANQGVQRYAATPDAQNYNEKWFAPTGNLQIPVVSVHNLWDPLVPYFHEAAYAQAVAEAGSSAMLLQRAVANYGHCNFPTSLVLSSFQTLVDWVQTGVKPAS